MISLVNENHEKWQTVTPVPFCIGFYYANLLKSTLKQFVHTQEIQSYNNPYQYDFKIISKMNPVRIIFIYIYIRLCYCQLKESQLVNTFSLKHERL